MGPVVEGYLFSISVIISGGLLAQTYGNKINLWKNCKTHATFTLVQLPSATMSTEAPVCIVTSLVKISSIEVNNSNLKICVVL